MYLFYVVDGLDIKKLKKKWIFLYQTIISDNFPIILIFSSRRFNPKDD